MFPLCVKTIKKKMVEANLFCTQLHGKIFIGSHMSVFAYFPFCSIFFTQSSDRKTTSLISFLWNFSPPPPCFLRKQAGGKSFHLSKENISFACA